MPDPLPIPATPTTDPGGGGALALWRLVCAWVAEPPRQPPAQEERAEGEGHAHAGGTVLDVVWRRRVGGGAAPLSQRSGHGVPPPVRKRAGAVQRNTRTIKHGTSDIYGVGLTACSGDSWRDTVAKQPDDVSGHACGGTDGSCHAPNDLPRRLSRLRGAAAVARPRPHRRAGHHAVPDGRAGRPCASLSGWPCLPYLVQLLPASGLSAMCVSPDRALAGAATGAAPGV